jgi:hypothetical protein
MSNRGSSVHLLTRLRAGRPGFDSRQGKCRDFSATSRPTVGPAKPPVNGYQRHFFSGGEATGAYGLPGLLLVAEYGGSFPRVEADGA